MADKGDLPWGSSIYRASSEDDESKRAWLPLQKVCYVVVLSAILILILILLIDLPSEQEPYDEQQLSGEAAGANMAALLKHQLVSRILLGKSGRQLVMGLLSDQLDRL